MSADDKRREAFDRTKMLLGMCRHFCSLWGTIQIADYAHHIGKSLKYSVLRTKLHHPDS